MAHVECLTVAAALRTEPAAESMQPLNRSSTRCSSTSNDAPSSSTSTGGDNSSADVLGPAELGPCEASDGSAAGGHGRSDDSSNQPVCDLSTSKPWDSAVLAKGSSFRPAGKGAAALNRRGALTKSQTLAAAALPGIPRVPSKYRAAAGAASNGISGPSPMSDSGGCQLQRLTTRDLQVSGVGVTSYFVRFVRNHPQLAHVVGVQIKVGIEQHGQLAATKNNMTAMLG